MFVSVYMQNTVCSGSIYLNCPANFMSILKYLFLYKIPVYIKIIQK